MHANVGAHGHVHVDVLAHTRACVRVQTHGHVHMRMRMPIIVLYPFCLGIFNNFDIQISIIGHNMWIIDIKLLELS